MPDDRNWQQRAIDAEVEVARLLAVLARIRREVVLADPRDDVRTRPAVTQPMPRVLAPPGASGIDDLEAVARAGGVACSFSCIACGCRLPREGALCESCAQTCRCPTCGALYPPETGVCLPCMAEHDAARAGKSGLR